MAVDILALNDPTTITAIITTIIAAIFAAYERYQKSITIDAMDPEKPQTEAQTKVIEKLPERIWAMSDADVAELSRQLKATGAVWTGDALERTIADMVEKKIVEFGIIVEDHDGIIETESQSAFVSYGSFTLMSKASAENRCTQRSAPAWYLAG